MYINEIVSISLAENTKYIQTEKYKFLKLLFILYVNIFLSLALSFNIWIYISFPWLIYNLILYFAFIKIWRKNSYSLIPLFLSIVIFVFVYIIFVDEFKRIILSIIRMFLR